MQWQLSQAHLTGVGGGGDVGDMSELPHRHFPPRLPCGQTQVTPKVTPKVTQRLWTSGVEIKPFSIHFDPSAIILRQAKEGIVGRKNVCGPAQRSGVLLQRS